MLLLNPVFNFNQAEKRAKIIVYTSVAERRKTFHIHFAARTQLHNNQLYQLL